MLGVSYLSIKIRKEGGVRKLFKGKNQKFSSLPFMYLNVYVNKVKISLKI